MLKRITLIVIAAAFLVGCGVFEVEANVIPADEDKADGGIHGRADATSSDDEEAAEAAPVDPADAAEEPVEEGDAGAVQVVGWMGFVTTAPEGAGADDFVTIYPWDEVGDFGIAGVDEAVEAQIVDLRDHAEPGKYAHFWGTLRCGVEDYNGCQLLVERMRVDGPGDFFEPDMVEGWEGVIVETPDAPQVDDVFILAGEYGVHYGIDSALDEAGEFILREEIEALRDSGQTVRLFGTIMCGIPDGGGCQIRVERLEVVE